MQERGSRPDQITRIKERTGGGTKLEHNIFQSSDSNGRKNNAKEGSVIHGCQSDQLHIPKFTSKR